MCFEFGDVAWNAFWFGSIAEVPSDSLVFGSSFGVLVVDGGGDNFWGWCSGLFDDGVPVVVGIDENGFEVIGDVGAGAVDVVVVDVVSVGGWRSSSACRFVSVVFGLVHGVGDLRRFCGAMGLWRIDYGMLSVGVSTEAVVVILVGLDCWAAIRVARLRRTEGEASVSSCLFAGGFNHFVFCFT